MNNMYLNQAGSFECVTEKPDAGWFGEAGEKKTPFVRIMLRVTDGQCAGQTIGYRGWLTEKAVDSTTERLAQVLNFDGDWNALYEGRTTLAGLPCNITTEMESYTDKTGQSKSVCKVAWLNPAGGGGPAPMEDAKVQNILKIIGPRSKAVAKAAKAATPSAPAQPMGPRDENDDVPF